VTARINARGTLGIFVLCSFAGWAADSLYRTILAGHLVLRGESFPPFYPTYGVGALLVTLVLPLVRKRSLIVRIASYALVTTGWELCAGLFLVAVLDWRLWDYSGRFLSLFGFVDLEHSLYWTILALVLEPFLYWAAWAKPRTLLHPVNPDAPEAARSASARHRPPTDRGAPRGSPLAANVRVIPAANGPSLVPGPGSATTTEPNSADVPRE